MLWARSAIKRALLSHMARAIVLIIPAFPLAAAPLAYIPAGTTITVIDTANNSVSNTFSPSLNQPYGVAVDPSGGRIFITNTVALNSFIAVVDAVSGSVIQAILGMNQPRGIAVSPDGKRLYVANAGAGTNADAVFEIDTDPSSVNLYTVIGTVSGWADPEGVAVRAASPNEIYVADTGSNTVSWFLAGGTTTVSIPVGAHPAGIALNPAGTRAYVANQVGNTVSVIDTTANPKAVISTISDASFSSPYGVAVSADGARVYVTNSNSTTVSVINAASNVVINTITVGNFPKGISFNPLGTRAYVANSGDSTVSVIDASSLTNIATLAVGLSPIALGNFMGPAVSLLPSSLTFSGQMVDTTSAANTATLTNAGATAISISSILISGDFAQTNTCGTLPATLAAGASCTFSVTFTPTLAGSRSGALRVSTDAANSQHSVTLSGTGTETSSGGGGGGGGCITGSDGGLDVTLLAVVFAAFVLQKANRRCAPINANKPLGF